MGTGRDSVRRTALMCCLWACLASARFKAVLGVDHSVHTLNGSQPGLQYDGTRAGCWRCDRQAIGPPASRPPPSPQVSFPTDVIRWG